LVRSDEDIMRWLGGPAMPHNMIAHGEEDSGHG
jgi:hypothetical protein